MEMSVLVLSSRRITVFSPWTVGTTEVRTSIGRPSTRIENWPSCGRRRSTIIELSHHLEAAAECRTHPLGQHDRWTWRRRPGNGPAPAGLHRLDVDVGRPAANPLGEDPVDHLDHQGVLVDRNVWSSATSGGRRTARRPGSSRPRYAAPVGRVEQSFDVGPGTDLEARGRGRGWSAHGWRRCRADRQVATNTRPVSSRCATAGPCCGRAPRGSVRSLRLRLDLAQVRERAPRTGGRAAASAVSLMDPSWARIWPSWKRLSASPGCSAASAALPARSSVDRSQVEEDLTNRGRLDSTHSPIWELSAPSSTWSNSI